MSKSQKPEVERPKNTLRSPTAEQLMAVMVDIAEPKHGVSVETNGDRSVLWVNVDGICVLRICRMPHLHITKARRS